MSVRRGLARLGSFGGIAMGGSAAAVLRYYHSKHGDEEEKLRSFIDSVWATVAGGATGVPLHLGMPPGSPGFGAPWRLRVLARDDGSAGDGPSGGGGSSGSSGSFTGAGTPAEEQRTGLEELHARAQALVQQGQDLSEAWEEVWSTSQRRDADGEAIINELAEALRRAGKTFTDDAFPADDRSLFRSGGRAPNASEDADGGSFRKDLDPFLAGFGAGDIQWKRAREIGPKGALTPVVFSSDLSPDDIAQGNLGDCYYLAALAACATATDDVLLNDLIVEEGHDVGLYGVKFFVNGRWVTVVVDDLFPCVQQPPGSGVWQPLFAHSTPHDGEEAAASECELWVMLMEKAFAKLHGSYEAIVGGQTEDALNYLCGGKTGLFDFDTDPDAWDLLTGALSKGREHEERQIFLCASIRPELGSDPAQAAALQEMGLCTGHAYTVMDAVELPLPALDSGGGGGGTVRVVQLRNPWGTFEWRGEWNDEDPRWTPELHALTAQAAGGDCSAEDDGSFFMSQSDFVKYCGKVGVCDPWPSIQDDSDGDGIADTSRIAGIQLLAGEEASCRLLSPSPTATAGATAGGATEVAITAYQRDNRSAEVDPATGLPRPFETVRVGVKCQATGGEWMDDVMSFPLRAFARTIPLAPGETSIQLRAFVGDEQQQPPHVWFSVSASGGCTLHGPPRAPAPAPAPAPLPVAQASEEPVEQKQGQEQSAGLTIEVDLGGQAAPEKEGEVEGQTLPVSALSAVSASAPAAAVHSAPPPSSSPPSATTTDNAVAAAAAAAEEEPGYVVVVAAAAESVGADGGGAEEGAREGGGEGADDAAAVQRGEQEAAVSASPLIDAVEGQIRAAMDVVDSDSDSSGGGGGSADQGSDSPGQNDSETGSGNNADADDTDTDTDTATTNAAVGTEGAKGGDADAADSSSQSFLLLLATPPPSQPTEPVATEPATEPLPQEEQQEEQAGADAATEEESAPQADEVVDVGTTQEEAEGEEQGAGGGGGSLLTAEVASRESVTAVYSAPPPALAAQATTAAAAAEEEIQEQGGATEDAETAAAADNAASTAQASAEVTVVVVAAAAAAAAAEQVETVSSEGDSEGQQQQEQEEQERQKQQQAQQRPAMTLMAESATVPAAAVRSAPPPPPPTPPPPPKSAPSPTARLETAEEATEPRPKVPEGGGCPPPAAAAPVDAPLPPLQMSAATTFWLYAAGTYCCGMLALSIRSCTSRS